MEQIHQLGRLTLVNWPAHDRSRPIVELENVTVRYNGNTALENVSFSLQRGEQVAIIGPNGAGKSTLFNVIAGVVSPAEGQVRIYGDTPDEHICIAYVPQRSRADWSFPVNVFDVVMMGRVGKMGLFRWPTRRDRQIVRQALEVVEMDHLAKRQISELSGGQQQRVFIARALAQEAELMLMDEPLTGLDIKSQEAIFSILNRLRARQVTILLATHDLNLAADRFDRLMLLNRRLIGFGSPDQVLTHDLLNRAYSGHMRLIDTPNGTMVISDTCCGGGEH
ncbi:MAG: metal ABC transporter ATP-binding protein [Chloroflexi bacterium]|nr:MAG: metal ABC transporter ATP-binding protein [Chloroflexota bacterium]